MKQGLEEHLKKCSQVSTKQDNGTEKESPSGNHNS